MSSVTKPLRTWSKSPEDLDEKALNSIQRREMVEVPQGGDNPSKFLYRDIGGHLYWVSLQPYKLLEKVND